MVVSQGWLHEGWRPRFTASHLSWTTCPELQHLAVVKVHGVFPSNHWYSASSPRLQFHRIPRRDSAQVVTPFVQVGTSRDSSVSGGADYPFTLTSQGPASDHGFGFAEAVTAISRPNKDDQSLRGQTRSVSTSHGITLSRHDVLEARYTRRASPLLAGFSHWDYSHLGQFIVITRQGISLP